MIKFFRKIRKKLLMGNLPTGQAGKTSRPAFAAGRYFKYAIGEIALVMIGILLALQVNTWNENKKANTNFNKSLVNVFNDLEIDLVRVQDVNAYYKRIDTVVDNIINGNYSEADYRKNPGLGRVIFYAYEFQVTDMGYNVLMQKTENIPVGYEQLIAELNQQYIKTKENVEGRYNGLYILRTSNHKRYALNYPWFSQRDSMNIEKSVQHYANNTIFKNEADLFKYFGPRDYGRSIQNFYGQGLSLYLTLKTILKDKSPLPRFFPKNAEGYDAIKNDYLGSYVSERGTNLIIKKQNDFLFVSRDDLPNTSLITMTSKDTFYNHRNGVTLTFKRDESNKVIGWSNINNTMHKVEDND
tara:strand:- start:457 stop:1521 length:1065 start_codon:yes stop_codon:yes gene_type:complete